MKAAIYARFSSDRQSERSIDDQVALCRTVCEREGFIVGAVYDDRAISGASTLNRLGLQRLLRDAKARAFDVVVTEALDRISRDQADLADIYKRLRFVGIGIVTAQDGAASDIHIGVKGLLGQMYLRDLAQKTHRGQAGVVRDGRHNGGRSFGYRAVPGKPGELAIDEVKAQTVRRIFADYLAGHSPRSIAAALNAAGAAGPRGSVWNASTIAGSRKRQNGILQNELYAGVIVWNRQRFIKDPDTGKRVSRPNPPSEWMTAKAEHLRIIDDDTWQRTRARHSERGGPQARRLATRPQHLLSGLVRCGVCGSSYVSGGISRRGAVLRCSRMRETGLCDNRHSIGRDEVESRVLRAIEQDLASPALIAEYVREYHRARNELARSSAGRRETAQARLRELSGLIDKTVDAIVAAGISRALQDRLAALEAERDALEAEIAAAVPQTLSFHPRAAATMASRVAELKAALDSADPDNRAHATAAIRSLIEKIVIHPPEPGAARSKKPADIEVHGQLATMLQLSEPTGKDSVGLVVAGARNHLKLLFRAAA